MKIYLVNFGNCINYSQYGPFFFEVIKKGKLRIFSEPASMSELDDVRESIMAEINRSSYTSERKALVLLIPRDADREISGEQCDFYNEILIHKKLNTVLPCFSEVLTIYIDSTIDTSGGRNVEKMKKLSRELVSDIPSLDGYLINKCIEDTPNFCDNFKEILTESAENLKDSFMKEFFLSVISDRMPSVMCDESCRNNILKFFAIKCYEVLPRVRSIYELIDKNSISDNIRKKIKIVEYIKLLTETENFENIKYDEFNPDYERIKVMIKSYIERLGRWLEEDHSRNFESDKTIYRYSPVNNVEQFNNCIDEIIASSFKNVTVSGKVDGGAMKSIFERLEDIVSDTNSEIERLARIDIEHFSDHENYTVGEVEEKIHNGNGEDTAYEKELTERLNNNTPLTLPGYTEQLRLEQELDAAGDRIQKLLQSAKEYSFKTFLRTLLFAVLGVSGLYLLAQVNVLRTENSFSVYFIYCVLVAGLFSTVYSLKRVNYKRKIRIILEECIEKVKEYLRNYKNLAEEFENNLNNTAEYACFRDYMDRKKRIIQNNKEENARYSWHKRKVSEILENMKHFSGFIKDAEITQSMTSPVFDDFRHDAENTEFYQMKNG